MINNSEKIKEDNFKEEVEKIIDFLPKRSAEILEKRFGLRKEHKKTLEKIGLEYGITRERVRQIIADSLKKIDKMKNGNFSDFEKKVICILESRNGIISKKDLFGDLKAESEEEKNAVDFLLKCSSGFKEIGFKGFVRESVAVKNFSLDGIRKVEKTALDFFEKRKKISLLEDIADFVAERSDEYSKNEIENWLLVLDKIKNNNFGKWGIKTWSEINPKNTREKIYLVLRETKKPLHFLRIAQIIDEKKMSKRKAHPQTVHNELIKDDRFILIGRGIYALSEWGYFQGTVKDVIEKILREKGPLSKEDIFPEIMKVRKVKKATVMINLNNSKFFIRENNLYSVIA